MPQSDPGIVELTAGAALNVIAADGDRITARTGFILVARRSRVPGAELWRRVHAFDTVVVDQPGVWLVHNGGTCGATFSVTRMGPAYADLRRMP